MDKLILDELSHYIGWEGNPRWTALPATPALLADLRLPDAWKAAVAGSHPTEQRIALLWGGLQDRLPRSFRAFIDGLYGLALLQTDQRGLSLVYVFQREYGLTARRGFAPAASLPEIVALFSTDLAPLYAVHDGLVDLMSYDAGPLPSGDWETILDPGTGAPDFVKVALDGSMALGFDVSARPAEAYALSPDEDAVEPVSDVWDFLDTLIAGGLGENRA
jgi:hypothetical protein